MKLTTHCHNLLVNNVFAYHNNKQWEEACSYKNTAKKLVQKIYKYTCLVKSNHNNLLINNALSLTTTWKRGYIVNFPTTRRLNETLTHSQPYTVIYTLVNKLTAQYTLSISLLSIKGEGISKNSSNYKVEYRDGTNKRQTRSG